MSTVTVTEIEAFGFHLPLEILLAQGFILLVAAIVIGVAAVCKEGTRQVAQSLARALPPRPPAAGDDALPPLPQRVPGATLADFFTASEAARCQHEWIPARTLDGDERDLCMRCGDRSQAVPAQASATLWTTQKPKDTDSGDWTEIAPGVWSCHIDPVLEPLTADEAQWLDLEFHEEAGQ